MTAGVNYSCLCWFETWKNLTKLELVIMIFVCFFYVSALLKSVIIITVSGADGFVVDFLLTYIVFSMRKMLNIMTIRNIVVLCWMSKKKMLTFHRIYFCIKTFQGYHNIFAIASIEIILSAKNILFSILFAVFLHTYLSFLFSYCISSQN